MGDDIRENLTTLIAVTVIGTAICAFALMQVLGNVGNLDVNTFGNLIFLIPCAIMVLGSFVIMLLSQKVGRGLYLAVLGICLVLGVVSMVVTSIWAADPNVAAQLLANSPEGATVIPPSNAPIIVMRDIAAYVVCPTVGCIAGAWLGSRLHPVESATPPRKKSRKSKR